MSFIHKGLLLLIMVLFREVSVKANLLTKVKFCKFRGVSLYTEAYNYADNEEEAIVFLHGLGGNHNDGSFLYNSQNKHMTVSIDMLNHGKSGKLENLTFDMCVDSIKAVIDEYGIKKVYFVGHSLGADFAMMYALKYPEYVADLVLLDRGYYNYSELMEFNFTPSFFKVVEYSADLDVDIKSFNSLIEMSFNNEISKTWGINKDVLLIGADPYWPTNMDGKQSIVDFIKLAKKSPSDFGITIGQAFSLPDLTRENLNDYMQFLKTKIDEFELINNRFFVIRTSYNHNMINNDLAKGDLIKVVLEFIRNNNKQIAIEKINKYVLGH